MVLHDHLRGYPFEFVVRRFQVAQSLNIGRLHAAVLRFSRVVRGFGDTELATYIFDLPPTLDLFQGSDDLALGEFILRIVDLLGV